MADGTPAIGHNNPPADPFEAIRIYCEDLYAEAKHWLDGAEISSDPEAEAVERLLDMAREIAKTADDARIEENKPFDEGKAAVQAKYAVLIGNTKAGKGSLVRMQEVCKAALEPWRIAKQAAARAAAEAARIEAEARANEAAEAARAAAGSLADAEVAEELVKQAEDAQRAAKQAEKAANTATGLTTYYEPVLTNQREAMLHYMKDQPAEFVALCQRLADVDVRGGKRTIPGFSVEERKRAR